MVIVVHSDTQQVGLMMDAVCDIITVTEDSLRPPPEIGGRVKDYVLGVISTAGAIVSLLSLQNVPPESFAAAA